MARFAARIARIEREAAEVTTCAGKVRRKVIMTAGERYAPDPARDTCPRLVPALLSRPRNDPTR